MKPQDGYISYVINPKSGASSSNFIGKRFLDYLLKNKFDVRTRYTGSIEDAYKFATEAAADSRCGLVAVCGGDGTIREVVRGLQNGEKRLVIVPGGTENLLANELGYDEKVKTIINAFESGIEKALDIGSANGRCFTSITGFGFDAQIVKSLNEDRQGNIDYLDYVWPIWRAFWKYKFCPIKVNVDGEEVFHGPGLVFVGNISRYAMGLGILRNADYGDGLLDVCIYKCGGRVRFVKHSLMTLMKYHTKCSDVIYRQGRNIKIASGNGIVYCQIDGDPGPDLPVEIKVIPLAVKVLVPENARPAGIRTRLIRAIG